LVDDLRLGPDHLDAELLEDAMAMQVHCRVEASLPAERRQESVGAFLLDDLGDDFPGDRLDVGAVSRSRVRHDGGRVGIDENDAVAFFAKCLASLSAGIIKFACLPDDDGTGADEQDFLQIVTLRHLQMVSILKPWGEVLRTPGIRAKKLMDTIGERT